MVDITLANMDNMEQPAARSSALQQRLQQRREMFLKESDKGGSATPTQVRETGALVILVGVIIKIKIAGF